MTETMLKAPRPRRSAAADDDAMGTKSKRPRTAEDFYLFCTFILEHEKYEVLKQQELRDKASSPLGSTGSMSDSVRSESAESNNHEDMKSPDSDAVQTSSAQDWNWNGIHFSDEDSYDLVTCYCSKPYAGRSMIECSKCLTWIHLSCAKIKKSNIPEVFICIKCKTQKYPNIPPNSSVRPKKREVTPSTVSSNMDINCHG